jgi:hypothetical protein
VPKKPQHVTQVGSPFIQEQHREPYVEEDGRKMTRHPSALAGELDPGVECLVA